MTNALFISAYRIKHILLLLCLSILLTACTKDNLQKLDGEWKCDAKATVALYDGSLKDLPKASELAAAMLENLSYLFHVESKKVTRSFSGLADVSNFTVVSDKDKNIIVQVDANKMHIEFKDDNTILVGSSDNDDMKAVFIRVKK